MNARPTQGCSRLSSAHQPIVRRGNWPRVIRGRICVGYQAATGLPCYVSDREKQVWKLLAENHTTRGAALILGLSHKTVELYRANLQHHLGYWGIAALTKLALKVKLTKVNVIARE